MNENDIKKIASRVGEYISSGIAEGFAENSKESVQAFAGFYEALKYQRDFDLISNEEYYDELESLRDKFFAAGSDNWMKYTAKIYAYEKKTLEQEKKEIQALYDDAADYAVKKLDEILKKQEKLAEKLNSSGALFKHNKVIMGDSVDYYYSLGDMENDIAAVKRYGDDFENLSERISKMGDVGDGLLDKIKGMDLQEALGFMQALLQADDEEFSKFVSLADAKENLSAGVAARQYEEEFASGVRDAYANMTEEISAAGLEIPKGFYASGSISAQKFGEAFIEELDSQLALVRTRIDEFNAKLTSDIGLRTGGNNYTTNNTSYNISTQSGEELVDRLRRNNAFMRLAGLE